MGIVGEFHCPNNLRATDEFQAEVGGVLYGMLNMLFGHSCGEITVKSSDIDLLRKIAEAEPFMGELSFKLAQIHRKINEESRRINEIEWLPTL